MLLNVDEDDVTELILHILDMSMVEASVKVQIAMVEQEIVAVGYDFEREFFFVRLQDALPRGVVVQVSERKS